MVRTKYYKFKGGLDLVSGALAIYPGGALGMFNYEPTPGGYRRVYGFERFDGRPKPSDASFIGFKVQPNFDVEVAVGFALGTTVTGATSGATGIVCGFWYDDGTYGFDALAVTKVTGTFISGELVTTGVDDASITSTPITRYAPDQDLEDLWLQEAMDIYRDDIGQVPGSGPVLGVWQRDETVYAIRDDDDSAGLSNLYISTSSGWDNDAVTMAKYIFFDAGDPDYDSVEEGDTINGETSGATAQVHRKILHGGAPGTNDAFGYLVLVNVVGAFQDNENLRKATTVFAVAASLALQFTFAPGGNYRFFNHNFFAGSDTYRTYGVNGVGPAFEIDEFHIVSPILFPQTPAANQPEFNRPYLIEEHRNHLFMALPGGTYQHSVPGEPLVFNGFLGAAEFGAGAELTGLTSVTGGVLVVNTERQTFGLFGTGVDDWEQRVLGNRTGGKLYTPQSLDTVYSLGDIGITSLSRTQTFGDFAGATESQLIQPLVEQLRQTVTDATIVRSTNQYRLYFEDGSVIIMYVPTLGAENAGTGVTEKAQFGYAIYPITVRRIYNCEDEEGAEASYFASDDGYVYQDRVGPSWDGESIQSALKLPFNHLGSPGFRKRWRRADVELKATRRLRLRYNYDLSYGDNNDSQSGYGDIRVSAGGGLFDIANFDQFNWDGQDVSTARANLTGSGENIGMLIYHDSAIEGSFVLQGIVFHYEARRPQR